jgi:trimeric autotransporter adhesin
MKKGNTSPNLSGYNATSGGQGNYNFSMGADRANANILYIAAHCVWKSTNGGSTWTQLTDWWAVSYRYAPDRNFATRQHQIVQYE